jgi:2-amino-4-hydroxy-6-hydroxymethyldihydropteridine diphosphokinase
MGKTSFAIALGSNRRSRHGSPVETVRAAADVLKPLAMSRVRLTPAMGPAGRGFANAVLLLETAVEPPELLAELKTLERGFGRRGARRWGPRVLDLDIILWSEGAWGDASLTVPHPQFRTRSFVLEPLAELVSCWRDPVTGLTVRQLLARARAPSPVDRGIART